MSKRGTEMVVFFTQFHYRRGRERVPGVDESDSVAVGPFGFSDGCSREVSCGDDDSVCPWGYAATQLGGRF